MHDGESIWEEACALTKFRGSGKYFELEAQASAMKEVEVEILGTGRR
jgi:hypothetical protein